MNPSPVALITGAARGIGAAISLSLARDGYDLLLLDLNPKDLESVQSQIKGMGRKAELLSCDVSNHLASKSAVEAGFSVFSRIDVLVNNAGVLRDAMLHKLTEENWDQVIDVNLKGAFNVGQAVAKKMMERKSGRIINVASIAWTGNVGQSNYSAAKAGLVGLTYTWALELARHGITCNAVAPGFIDTQMTQGVPSEIKEAFIQRIPLKRMGKPQDIADVVSFLASEKSSYLTGQCIHIDGGLTTGLA